ncbi:MAG: CYTH domain-containing protein [Oscillospiraceae bacterium]|nr:CYTH domain-containing protein [Oscillospiraceae bacterium]
MGMGTEFELKYRATAQQLAGVRRDLSGEEQKIKMQTQYYDTPSGALSARRCTLRRRMENGVSICTLKYPVSGPGRGEIEVACDALEDALPELCRQSGLEELPGLLQEGLVPVCGARFTRIAKTVLWQGAVLELALDEGVLTGGGKEEPFCEIEVELKDGPEEAVLHCGAFLQAAYGFIPEGKSKFRRARDLRLREGD